jgi:hypothetical protein
MIEATQRRKKRSGKKKLGAVSLQKAQSSADLRQLAVLLAAHPQGRPLEQPVAVQSGLQDVRKGPGKISKR